MEIGVNIHQSMHGMLDASTKKSSPFVQSAHKIAAIANTHAAQVDRASRFPHEAMAAVREHKLLGAMVPTTFGGSGASVRDIVEVCFILGQTCASTAMIFAMHHVKAACIIGHYGESPWHMAFMRRMVTDQLLLASSTTEGQSGGDVRNSTGPVIEDGGFFTLERAATVLSYGEQADALVTTARRSAAAAASDQVLVILDKSDYSLTPTFGWETLGMRGTCSTGFGLKARGQIGQIMPVDYATIHAESMIPSAHLMWGGVWAGIAAGAHERARRHLRKLATSSGTVPSGITWLNRAATHLTALRAMLNNTLDQYENAASTPDLLNQLDIQTAITLLKVDVSELAVASVMASLRANGLPGYREDGEASNARALRDVLSAPLMINNDRILGNLGISPLMISMPATLTA